MQTRIAAVRRHGPPRPEPADRPAPAAVFYLTGVADRARERLLALALAADGASHLFVNRLFPPPRPGGSPCMCTATGRTPRRTSPRCSSPARWGWTGSGPARF